MAYRAILVTAILLFYQQLAFPQSPSELVNRMVQNELAADKNDHSHWMYLDSNSEKGKTTVEEVIQTPEGWMHRLISINGQPPTDDQKSKNEQELQRFVNDPQYRRQQREKLDKDANKATQLLSMLPKAFLYQFRGKQNGTIELSFTPNPQFEPPNREAKVFHNMAGTLLIDEGSLRLKKLSGHLINNVEFGAGLLGKLSKGGTFEVDQQDVGGGHWELTRLDVHISGHALFFATIREQQHEVISEFHQVPPSTTISEAARMLNTAATTQIAEISTHSNAISQARKTR
jgi:hypothetical protein